MSRYHTPRDELSALSLASLQHHGDNALSSLRALTETPRSGSGRDAVFFDVLGFRVVHFSGALSPWLGAGSAFLLFVALAFGMLGGAFRGNAFVYSLLLVPAVIAASMVVALGVDLALRVLGALPAPWVAHPEPTLAVCVLIAAGAITGLAAAAGPERSVALWAAIWTWFCLGAGAAIAALPGTSFLFLAPALTAGIFGLPWFLLRRGSAVWSLLAGLMPVLVVSVLWLPKLSLLYAAVGFVSVPIFCLPFVLPALSLAPLLSSPPGSLRRALLFSIAVLVPAGVATAAYVPRASKDHPARLSLGFHQDLDTSTARYLADVTWAPLPAALAGAGMQFVPADPRPWAGVGRALGAPAPKLELPAPELEVTHRETGPRGERRLRGRLRSPRGAPLVRLELSSMVKLRIGGVKASPRFESPSYAYTFVLPDSNGVELDLEIDTAASVSGLLVDHSYGLPKGREVLGPLRGDAAVPFHFGDATIVSRGMDF
jgi:hypothetical protein